MSRKKSYFTTFLGVPERIKKTRGGLTQTEFGRIIGKTQGTVQKYEKGTILPDEEVLKKIANHGGVTVEWLLKGEAAPAPAQTAEHVPETYEARPVELNVDALARIIAAARAYLRRHPEPLTNLAEAQFFADLYYYWTDRKKFPDDQVMNNLIPLAKRADLKKEG